MKLPRVRITIAGLMALVLLVGVGLWVQNQARKRQKPSDAEILAQTDYVVAQLEREMAELQVSQLGTLSLLDSMAGLEQALKGIDGVKSPSDLPNLRLKRPVEPGRTPTLDDLDLPPPPPGRVREREAQAKAQHDKLAECRAKEARAKAAYERERARRLSWW